MFLINNVILANRIRKILSRNNIDIAHLIPGRLRLKCTGWQDKEDRIYQFLQELEKEPKIESAQYTPETGSLLILFDKSLLQEIQIIEKWLTRAEQIINS
ncbi:hypothetical protein BHU72_06445 [Desulfuribacillus stibiiarsenatis]|uniref:Transcription-repair-coupling factor C-terminal domain-containing protein n=1 Tax=Desulfuribacillus stibiiarsenatis TaxID=1390249 RepID=A0A1E5L5J1_9FIRM|nr:hypothetical protein [Desulfuribacillus stibiiarsenatis]OEH85239.1 hypothetical protein BHU72_06445 [Desulfuribacillus stibiiarsenatis]